MPARQLWMFLTELDVDARVAESAAREPGLSVSRGRYLRGDPQDLLRDPEKLERRESLPNESRIYLLHRKHSADIVSLSKIASLWRGASSGVIWKPGESRRNHGFTFSGSSVRCQAIAMR